MWPGSLPENVATALLLLHFFVSLWMGARLDAKAALMLQYFRELAFLVTQTAHEQEVSFNYDLNTILTVTAAGTVFGFQELLNKINQLRARSLKQHWHHMVETGHLSLDIFNEENPGAQPPFVDLLIFRCIAEKVRREKKQYRWGTGIETFLKNLRNAILAFIDVILNNRVVAYMSENDAYHEAAPSSRMRRRTGIILLLWWTSLLQQQFDIKSCE